jgi:hypothetical protein
MPRPDPPGLAEGEEDGKETDDPPEKDGGPHMRVNTAGRASPSSWRDEDRCDNPKAPLDHHQHGEDTICATIDALAVCIIQLGRKRTGGKCRSVRKCSVIVIYLL